MRTEIKKIASDVRSYRTKKPQATKPLTIDRLQEMKNYANRLRASFPPPAVGPSHWRVVRQSRIPVAMLLIMGFLVPSLPFQWKEASAAGVNLIQNPSLETGGTLPDSWGEGQWGSNTATFTYPVTGIEGTKAIRVDMTAYTDGDAKWYFADVPVTAGATYVFSDNYISNLDTEADLQYTTADGTTNYLYLGIVPASTATTTKLFTFTMPANTVSASVFHLIAEVGYLVTDNYSLVEQVENGGTDTTPPSVEITFPTNASSVTGTTTVTATASDPSSPSGQVTTGVSGVQFVLDGVNFGAEDIVSPYSIEMNANEGTHILSAKARDAAGNMATSSPVSFIVTAAGGGDTTAPTATITSPADGSTLSGKNTISASSTDNVDVTGVMLLIDNVAIGAEDTLAPYDFLWDTTAATNGTHSLTVSSRDTSNNVTISSPVSVTVNNIPFADTTPPSVRLVAPQDGTAVATTTTLSFDVTDDIGVLGVSLFIDGIQVGVEKTNTPYDFLWNTSSYTNDSHIVYAKARDAAGNTATSTSASLTVNNIVLPPNLIGNPLLETVGANGDPSGWFRGNWGTNTATFTYPTPGLDNAKAATIEMTNYVSGDAKWYFANVPVTGGKIYSYTDTYLSTVPTEITAQMQTATGTMYLYIDTAPASPEWKTETLNIPVPQGVTSLSIFHSIGENGTLSVDNFSLTLGSTPVPASLLFTRGLVSLSFDDGWITQYADAFPILSAAGIQGTFYIISKETMNANPTELIQNPFLDTAGTNGDPANWFRGGWGTNTVSYTYPITGADGGSAAKIVVSDYANGDAKWYFGDAAVLPNEQYILTDKYQSDTTSVITLRYTLQDGSIQYTDIATLPSSNGTWKNFIQTITIPANVASVTAFHLLNGNGSLTVDNYSLSMISTYIDQAQMLEIRNAGNEIGGHTQTHVSLSGNLEGGVTVTPDQANAEIVGSRTDLSGMGITSLTTMAYPYGDYNSAVKTMAKNAGFLAARSVDRGFNLKNTDKYALKIQQMDRTTTMTDVQSWVSQAAADKTWLILMFHQEDNNPLHDLGVTPEFLQQIVDYIKTANVDVVTVDQGVAQMNP